MHLIHLHLSYLFTLLLLSVNEKGDFILEYVNILKYKSFLQHLLSFILWTWPGKTDPFCEEVYRIKAQR